MVQSINNDDDDTISQAASDTTEDSLHSLIQPANLFIMPDEKVYEIIRVGKEDIEYHLSDKPDSIIKTLSKHDPVFRRGLCFYNGVEDE